MKEITIDSNGQNVTFTTTSICMDGKTYPYRDIAEVYHSGEKRVFGFVCGQDRKLIYASPENADLLAALFDRIEKIGGKAGAPSEEAPHKGQGPAEAAPENRAPAADAPDVAQSAPEDRAPAPDAAEAAPEDHTDVPEDAEEKEKAEDAETSSASGIPRDRLFIWIELILAVLLLGLGVRLLFFS